MCLITKQKRPYIANEDMVVYKILIENVNGIFSLYRDYSWNIDSLESTEMGVRTAFAFDVRVFSEDQKHQIENKGELVTAVSEGFHSITEIDDANEFLYTSTDRRIFECIIPKGSAYYLDDTYLCVSNQIIIKRRIDNDN